MVLRVGLIIPSSNRQVEEEMMPRFPPGVQPHVTRLRITGANHKAFDDLLPMVADATRTLMDARCDAIAFHCTANSMEAGPAGEARILQAMRSVGAETVTTTATAIRAALAALNARRIVLVTPYTAQVTAKEAKFLADTGFDIVHSAALDLGGSNAYYSTPARFWRETVIAARREAADAYLVSCANISVFPVIDAIEAALERPVVTSNQSLLWDLITRLGVRGAGLPGQLFDLGGAVAP